MLSIHAMCIYHCVEDMMYANLFYNLYEWYFDGLVIAAATIVEFNYLGSLNHCHSMAWYIRCEID